MKNPTRLTGKKSDFVVQIETSQRFGEHAAQERVAKMETPPRYKVVKIISGHSLIMYKGLQTFIVLF